MDGTVSAVLAPAIARSTSRVTRCSSVVEKKHFQCPVAGAEFRTSHLRGDSSIRTLIHDIALRLNCEAIPDVPPVLNRENADRSFRA